MCVLFHVAHTFFFFSVFEYKLKQFSVINALWLSITQVLIIPQVSALALLVPHQNEINTSADRRKTFSSSWWSCSEKLIDSWLYPVIFLSLRTLLLMIHMKFFHKQKHWKIHVVLDCMEDPLFARGQNRKSKKADCECEYVSAPQVLFAELQVDAWMTWHSFSWLHCWWHLESLAYRPVFNVKTEWKIKNKWWGVF